MRHVATCPLVLLLDHLNTPEPERLIHSQSTHLEHGHNMYEGSRSRFLEKSIPFAWNALPPGLSIMAASHHSGLCSCHLLREAFPKALHPQSGEALPPPHTHIHVCRNMSMHPCLYTASRSSSLYPDVFSTEHLPLLEIPVSLPSFTHAIFVCCLLSPTQMEALLWQQLGFTVFSGSIAAFGWNESLWGSCHPSFWV